MENADKVSTTIEAAEAPSVETPASPEEPKLIDNPEIVYDGDEEEQPGVETVYDDAPEPSFEATRLANGVSNGLVEADNGGDIVGGFTKGFMSTENTVDSGFSNNLEVGTRNVVATLGRVADPIDVGNLVASRVKEATDDSLLGKYKAYVRTFPGSEELSAKEIEEAAYAAFTQHKIAEVWDGMSTGAVVSDFVQMVLLPTDNYKMGAVAEYFGLKHDAGDYVLKGGFVKQFATALADIPPENRAHIYQQVADNWETIPGFDNKMELMSFLARMEGIDDAESAMMFFESFTDLIAIAGAPKAAKAAASATVKGVKFAKGLTGVVDNIVQRSNVLHRVAATKNVDLIADAAVAGAKGELKTVGVSPLDAANTMLPFESVQTLTQGAPKKVAAEILKRESLFAKLEKEAKMLDLPIDEAQKQTLIDKEIAALEKLDEVSSVRLVSRDNKGFTLEYESVLSDSLNKETELTLSTGKRMVVSSDEKVYYVRPESLEAATKETKNITDWWKSDKVKPELFDKPEIGLVPIKVNDDLSVTVGDAITSMRSRGGVGLQEVVFRPTDTGLWEDLTYRHAGILGSPNFKLPGIAKDLVQGPEMALHAGNRIKKKFDKIIRSAFKKLNGEQVKKVNGLVAEGEGKKVFTYDEAVGVGVNGVKYTPEEFQAYATVRQTFDSLKRLKEKEILAMADLQNVKRFELHGHLLSGKVYDDSAAAMSGFSSSKTHSNWYILEGKVVQADLTKDIIKEMYQKGYRLVKSDALQMYKSGTNAAEWVFKKADELIDPASRPILNHIPGYATRINENANFFLKKRVKVRIGDKEVDQWITEAYHDKYTDLEDYRKTLPNADDYQVFRDRELSSSAFDDDVISSFGGLFTGKRSSTPLQYGPPSAKMVGEQAPVLESLQRYIENVSRNMPLAIYREGIRQKWINTAIEKGVLNGFTGRESFAAIESLLNPKHPNYFFFKNSYDEIKLLTGIKTLDEMEWASRTHHIGRWFEESGSKIPFNKSMATFFYNGKLRDTAGALKSATYHALLGLYNMAQPFIQFSGIVFPVAANPLHGIRGLEGAMELTILDYMSKFGDISNISSKVLNMDLWKLWEESGIGASVYSSVDYTSRITSNLPYDAGLIRNVLAHSDIGVKIGEAGYARVAFATAYHHVAAALKRTPTSADLQAIIARTEQYRFNMSRANMAKFQRGAVTGFTGQFMQVQTKFLEKMLGSDFTAAEKFRMGVAQIGLYGAVGTPLIGSMAPAILSFMGVDTRNVEADTLSKLHKGALGWFFTDYLGSNAEISGRVALGNDFLEKSMKVILSPTSTAPVEMLAGASWAVLSRGADALQKSWYTGKVIMNADQVDSNMILGGARVIAEEWATIPASTRNMMKGMVMYNSKMYHNADGLPVFEYRDPSFTAAFFQSIGFQNREVRDWYEIADGGSVFDKPRAADSYAKTMASIMTKLINADVDKQDVYAAAYNSLLSAALTQRGGEDVLKQVIKYLEDPKGDWREKMMKGLKLYQAEYTEGLEEIIKRGNIRSNVTLGREMEKYGVE